MKLEHIAGDPALIQAAGLIAAFAERINGHFEGMEPRPFATIRHAAGGLLLDTTAPWEGGGTMSRSISKLDWEEADILGELLRVALSRSMERTIARRHELAQSWAEAAARSMSAPAAASRREDDGSAPANWQRAEDAA
ncbi:hypothetical protein [Chromobacterium haemolyticum]|uniref:hypothetical protein n=1 Tax=Chromobacterium haemolyticum TaxID=394935 RepID=UPI00307D8375